MVKQIEVSLQLPVKQNTKCSYGKMDFPYGKGPPGVRYQTYLLRTQTEIAGEITNWLQDPTRRKGERREREMPENQVMGLFRSRKRGLRDTI